MEQSGPIIFYETHAHLDYPDYAPDLPEVVARAERAGIARIITIGTDLASSRTAIELAGRFASVYAVVGCHPGNAFEAPADIRAALRDLAGHEKVVALGETGLDYHHLPSEKPEAGPEDDERYKEKQAAIFRQHLEVAAELGFNCVIHQRDAFSDTLAQFGLFSGQVRGVFHCFVGTEKEQEAIAALGSIVSFTGIVTFKNAPAVRQTLSATPLGKFMLETDSPYLAPVPYRGKRCEPAYVWEIAETVAKVKNCGLDELSQATCRTAHEFFPKLPPAR